MESVQSPTNVEAQMVLAFRADRYDLGWFHLIGLALAAAKVGKAQSKCFNLRG